MAILRFECHKCQDIWMAEERTVGTPRETCIDCGSTLDVREVDNARI